MHATRLATAVGLCFLPQGGLARDIERYPLYLAGEMQGAGGAWPGTRDTRPRGAHD
jgi:hypothetical protein